MTRKKHRYLVYPGWVTSKNDGDMHYISYAVLCTLYGVNRERCLDASPTSFMTKGYDRDYLDSLIKLTPRVDGDYKEHLAELEEDRAEENQQEADNG